MSSDALLGNRSLPPSLRGRCEELLHRAYFGLRHWWDLSTNQEYLLSKKRRLAFKVFILLIIVGGALVDPRRLLSSALSGPRGGVAAWYAVCTNFVAPAGLLAIPYHSRWFDIFISVWALADLQATHSNNPEWTLESAYWLHLGGLHSLTIVPILVFELVKLKLSKPVVINAMDNGVLGVNGSFVGMSLCILTVAFVVEWQQAACFHRLRKSNAVTQLLLDQATSGLCTLSREAGIIRGPSSAFMDNCGMFVHGATIFDFVDPDDFAKVQSLLDNRDTLSPPCAILCTFYRRPTLAGAPAAQFETKLVPYAVTESEVSVCLLKVAEERLAEAPARPRQGAEACAAGAAHEPRGGGALSPRSQGALSEPGTELGTEISWAVSKTTASSGSSRRRAPRTRTVAVQTLAERSARPPPMPESGELAALRRAGAPRSRRETGRIRISLNTSRRQVPEFEETPRETKAMRLIDAMGGINACGRGCCELHVCVTAAMQNLKLLGRQRCGNIRFGSRQCPECFALMDIPGDTVDDSALQECETCGKDVHLLHPNESISIRSTPVASDHASPAAKAPARWPGGSTFRVAIDRSGGAALGISVDIDDDAVVLIEKVGEGLFKQWNDRNEDAEVRGGDYLVEVNGISGNSRLICAECAETKPLEMIVLRRGPMF